VKCKILVLKELLGADFAGYPQNLEPKELRVKIFGNNNLDEECSHFRKARGAPCQPC
jgi:hypothetical protein